jgi:hypothetical protein
MTGFQARSLRSFLFAVLVLCAAASAARGQSGPPPFVPFPQFLQDVANATLSQYPNGAVTDPNVFAQMQQYILSYLYKGVQPSGSFVLDTSTFDCVPVMQQPSVRILGITSLDSPPPPTVPPPPAGGGGAPPGTDVPVASPLSLGLSDPYGNPISCADGTIPMRRITLDELTSFATLQLFFLKAPDGVDEPPLSKVETPAPSPAQAAPQAAMPAQPPAPPAPPPNNHRYAYGRQYTNNLGGSSWLNLWSPAINLGANQVFSLSQHWYGSGAGNTTQTVEGGWQVYPAHYNNSTNAATFIYWTPDGYTTGCYNLDCAGFVQVNNAYAIGGAWTNYSTRGGAQYIFNMTWTLFNGNWWLWLQGANPGSWVGYYPGRIFNGGQLTLNATRFTYGGETFGNASWPPMGSGQFAVNGWQQAAYQRTVYYFDLTSTPQWTNLPATQPTPACYTFSFFAGAGADWRSYFYFGGPGGGGC